MRRRTLLTLAISSALVIPLVTSGPAIAAEQDEQPTTYYVDNRAGSGCTDAGGGETEAAPLCSFAPLDGAELQPGDQVLLARGATFNEQLTLTGSGRADAWIQIDAYGSGARPRIIRDGLESDRAIRLDDPSYWSVSNLEIGSAGTGILVLFTQKMNEGLKFSDLSLHDITGIHHGSGSGAADRIWNSAGIEITAVPLTLSAGEYIVKGVDFTSVRGERNLDTISVDWFNGQNANKNETSPRAAEDVTINRAELLAGRRSGTGCDDGMRLTSIGNLRIINSTFDAQASCMSVTGTAAVYAAGVTHSGIYNNVFSNVADTDSPDQAGLDYECCFDDVEVSGNLFSSNAGAGLSFLGIHGPSTSSGTAGAWDYSLNHSVSANTFVNNGRGSIRRAGDDLVPEGVLRDNVYAEPYSNTFLYNDGGDFRGFEVTNNRAATAVADVYNSAQDFSSVQGQRGWGYVSRTSSGEWTSLVFDATNNRWTIPGGGVPLITGFELHPGATAGEQVARSWTAPQDGYVNIRSRVLKSNTTGGDGVIAEVLRGTESIVDAVTISGGDGVGTELNADRVWVEAGDTLYFALSSGADNTYDMTSWMPTVAYDAHSAEWDAASIDADWSATSGATATAEAGVVEVSTSAAAGGIISPANLSIAAADVTNVTLGISANASVERLEFTFTTAGSSETHVVPFATYATGLHSEYTLDLRAVTEWAGQIDTVGVRALNAGASFGIDEVRLGAYGSTKLPPREEQTGEAIRWDFDDAGDLEGWTLANHLTGGVSDGFLHLESIGNDPYLVSAAGLGVDADQSRYVRLSVRNASGIPVQAQVFFATAAAPGFSGGRVVSFTVPPSATFVELEVDMLRNAAWEGELTQLRIDPMRAPGVIDFDWIAISAAADVEPEPSAPAWDASTVYSTGDEVSAGGHTFVAQWWTQGETPGSSATGAWSEVGDTVTCDAETLSTWTSSWIYTGGEQVVSGGDVWRAKWWTRNQSPGDQWGPWERIGTCG